MSISTTAATITVICSGAFSYFFAGFTWLEYAVEKHKKLLMKKLEKDLLLTEERKDKKKNKFHKTNFNKKLHEIVSANSLSLRDTIKRNHPILSIIFFGHIIACDLDMEKVVDELRAEWEHKRWCDNLVISNSAKTQLMNKYEEEQKQRKKMDDAMHGW